MHKNRSQDGQMAIVALGVVAIMSLVAMVTGQRVVVDQRNERSGLDVSEALRDAEEGLEEIFGKDLGSTETTSGTTSNQVQYKITQMSEGVQRSVPMGRTYDVDTKGSEASNQIVIDFGDTCTNSTGVLVTAYFRNYTKKVLLSKNMPNSVTKNTCYFELRFGEYGFEGSELIRLKAIGENVEMTLQVSDTLPPLEYQVEAAATGEAQSANVNLRATKYHPQLPSIFDYALFSGDGDIKKE